MKFRTWQIGTVGPRNKRGTCKKTTFFESPRLNRSARFKDGRQPGIFPVGVNTEPVWQIGEEKAIRKASTPIDQSNS